MTAEEKKWKEKRLGNVEEMIELQRLTLAAYEAERDQLSGDLGLPPELELWGDERLLPCQAI